VLPQPSAKRDADPNGPRRAKPNGAGPTKADPTNGPGPDSANEPRRMTLRFDRRIHPRLADPRLVCKGVVPQLAHKDAVLPLARKGVVLRLARKGAGLPLAHKGAGLRSASAPPAAGRVDRRRGGTTRTVRGHAGSNRVAARVSVKGSVREPSVPEGRAAAPIWAHSARALVKVKVGAGPGRLGSKGGGVAVNCKGLDRGRDLDRRRGRAAGKLEFGLAD